MRLSPVTQIYVDADACPVREEVYRVAGRLGVRVYVVSNGSRPIRPPGLPYVEMVMVGEAMDAADDWIAERIAAADICVTADIPLASRCLAKGGRVVPPERPAIHRSEYFERARRPRDRPAPARTGHRRRWAAALHQSRSLAFSFGARHRGADGAARLGVIARGSIATKQSRSGALLARDCFAALAMTKKANRRLRPAPRHSRHRSIAMPP